MIPRGQHSLFRYVTPKGERNDRILGFRSGLAMSPGGAWIGIDGIRRATELAASPPTNLSLSSPGGSAVSTAPVYCSWSFDNPVQFLRCQGMPAERASSQRLALPSHARAKASNNTSPAAWARAGGPLQSSARPSWQS